MNSHLKLLSFLLFTTLLFGCPGNEPKADECDGVECERGICNPDDGECVNGTNCIGDEQCIDGYQCVAGTCSAISPCTTDDDCDRGVCDVDRCVNAVSCIDNTRCVDGFKCVSGSCEVDPCSDVDCPRGVCDPDTETCVNGEVCTRNSEAEDCIDGYYCYGQSCELPETICDEIGCTRGVCDPQLQECVDAEMCTRDSECLDGNYCADDGSCQINECDAQMRNCSRGVCDPASASCVNADNCTAADECVDGFSCVEGSCVPAGEECEGGCPGNQICTYVAADLVGVCDENPAGCNQVVDCVQTRVCNSGACGPGSACVDDALEPNDDIAGAIRIADLPGNLANGSICQGDIDVFSFNTDDSELFRGELVVDLVIDAADVGAGNLTVELEQPDGTMLTQTTDANGRARIVKTISVLDLGQYYVRITGDDGLYASGVGYSLFTGMFDEAVLAACAAPIALDRPITQNSSSGDSFQLGSSCTSDDNPAGENVYNFIVNQPSYVTITLDPAAGVDVSAAIRRRCETNEDIECVNASGPGFSEVLNAQLPPGEYFVVVQGPTGNTGGEYEITLEIQPLVCTEADTSCSDADTSRFCNSSGTDYEMVVCDAGCDMATGRCIRATDDVCFTATDLSMGGLTGISWDDFTNDYDPGANGCVPSNSTTSQTNGPDTAYRIDVPDGHVLQATLSVDFGDLGVLYLVEDCSDLATCVAGENAGGSGTDEELIYFNTSGSDETLYLIADVQSDSFGYGSSDLSVTVEPTVCTAGDRRCAGDSQETCNTLGTGWESAFCSFGCVANACEPITNDLCTGAVDLLSSGPFTGRITEFNSSYNIGFSGCTNRSASGNDATFSLTPAAGEVATVSVTADFDASLYVVTDCDSAAGTCVVGSDGISINDEMVQFLGDGTTTFYVIVDSQFTVSTPGIFTVSATTQTPTCTPGTALQCLSATDLEYCTELGVPATYTCDGGCMNSACGTPTGQICADPVVLTSGQTVSNDFNVPDTLNPGSGTVGACNFPSGADAPGADHIYAVDLTPGDWLFADYTASTSYATFYLLSDCADSQSCLAYGGQGTSGSLVYEATQSERVYIVMDRTSPSQTSLDFDLTVEIARQDCTPNSPPYCSDGTTLEYCDNLGFTRQYSCDGACVGVACDMPTGDVCIDAIALTAGQTVTGNWSSGTNSIQPAVPFDGTCEFDDIYAADGPEDVYRIDLQAGELLRADLTTTSSTGYVYILENCLDTTTCSDVNTQRGSGTVFHYAQSTGPVYVVVDSSSTTSSTPYDLTVDVSVGAVCAPGSTSCSAGTLNVCSGGGGSIESTAICGNGCSVGRCALETGIDTCATAPTTTGTIMYGSFDELTNDIEFTTSGCTGNTGIGPELVQAITAGPGDVIHAWIESFGSENVQLYLVSDCADVDNTCLDAVDGNTNDRAELYFAPSTFGTYYLVAEGTSSFSDEPFEFGVEVVPQECTPGDYACTSTGQTLEFCNSTGLYETYDCSGGCMNDACGTPTGQACFDALPMTSGDTDSGVYNTPNSINPGIGTFGNCVFDASEEPDGSDTIYSVDMSADQVLFVDYTSSSIYGMVYILGDCNDTSTCLAKTTDGSAGSLQYTATSDETVYVVMDRASSGTSTLGYDISIEVLTPNCDPTAGPSCSDANTLSYCSGGFSREYTCGGTAGTCTNGVCDTPTSDICLDALEVIDGDSIMDTFEGNDSLDLGSGTVGACDFGADDMPGTDHFYYADLLSGQTLDLAYSSSSSYGIVFLMTDCDDGTTCIDNTARAQTGSLTYTAATDERIYIVVDRALSGSTATYDYTLDVTIN